MRLADFIETNMEEILGEWESFARTLLPASRGLDVAALRDHAEQILVASAADLRTAQSVGQQSLKSRGGKLRPEGGPDTAAEMHGQLRATDGFTLQQMVAEYRALRASVLKLWAAHHTPGPDALVDMIRFNEAIDQAVAESVDFFALEAERWRNVFLGVLGHDLRGPLNSVLLTARLLSKLSDGTPASQVTERLIRGGERMRELLDDWLDFSRASLDLGVPTKPAAMDLALACKEEVDLQRVALPDSVIELVADGPIPGVWDSSRLKQVIGNLITNAAKYGDQASTIKVRASSAADGATFSVENTGSIEVADTSTLFEPLRRGVQGSSDSDGASLGLGLFIVRQIVLAHGGSVELASQSGKTVFTVNLPKTVPDAGAPA